MSFSDSMRAVNFTRQGLSRRVRGRIYTPDDIMDYMEAERDRIRSYMGLGVDGKVSAVMGESVTIRGMVDIPGASQFNEAIGTIYQIAKSKGDLSKVSDIRGSGFVDGIPLIEDTVPDVPMPFEESNITSNEIMARICGVSYPVSSAESGADLKKILSGMRERVQPAPPLPGMGDAFAPPPPPLLAAPELVPDVEYGIDPNIVIESPDVTVQSLNDEIDSGEF